MAEATLQLRIDGMHCAGCVGRVERAISSCTGVEGADVSLAGGRAVVRGTGMDAPSIETAVRALGFDAETVVERESLAERREALEERHRSAVRMWRWRVIVGACIWLPLESLHWGGSLVGIHAHAGVWLWLTVAASSIALVLVGSAFYASAIRAARSGTTNMDTLISIGATAAFGLSTVNLIRMTAYGATDAALYFTEAAGLLTLISIGHWLEASMTAKAGAALREMLSLQPDEVTRLDDVDAATGRAAPSGEVLPGDLVLVLPGDRVAVDGVIERGSSSIDEALVTGESLPVDRTEGDPVIAGSVNLTGRLVARATSDGKSTTVARMAELVLAAQSSKTTIQRLADRASSVFVPAVLAIALCTFLGWWLLGGDAVAGVLNATTLLVISCPCALGLAAPTAVMVGSGAASRRGILVRDAAALERASSVRVVAFDKTGTLTIGKPAVVEADDTTISSAAMLAAGSSHPLSMAILDEARARGLDVREARQVTERPGVGLAGSDGPHELELISSASARARSIKLPELPSDASVSVLLRDGELVGSIAFRDDPRADAGTTLATLRRQGLETWLLSGDRSEVAESIGDRLGFEPSSVLGDLTPEEKANRIESITRMVGPVAMVGDGINDAGALAAAGAAGGVGIAMGTGANIAMESADVVIPGDRLDSLSDLLSIGRESLRTIKQNLWLSFGYNSLAIPAAAFGLLGVHGPIIAAAAMALSDASVIGNSLRLAARLRPGGVPAPA